MQAVRHVRDGPAARQLIARQNGPAKDLAGPLACLPLLSQLVAQIT